MRDLFVLLALLAACDAVPIRIVNKGGSGQNKWFEGECVVNVAQRKYIGQWNMNITLSTDTHDLTIWAFNSTPLDQHQTGQWYYLTNKYEYFGRVEVRFQLKYAGATPSGECINDWDPRPTVMVTSEPEAAEEDELTSSVGMKIINKWGRNPNKWVEAECVFKLHKRMYIGQWKMKITLNKKTQDLKIWAFKLPPIEKHRKGKWYYLENKSEYTGKVEVRFQLRYKGRTPNGNCTSNIPPEVTTTYTPPVTSDVTTMSYTTLPTLTPSTSGMIPTTSNSVISTGSITLLPEIKEVPFTETHSWPENGVMTLEAMCKFPISEELSHFHVLIEFDEPIIDMVGITGTVVDVGGAGKWFYLVNNWPEYPPTVDVKFHAYFDTPGEPGGKCLLVDTESSTNLPSSVFPTNQPSTLPPTDQPSTPPPTDQPPTLPPTDQPSTLPPTDQPPTLPPTDQPSTLPPTDQPSTLPPTDQPPTLPPTDQPSTLPPTDQPPTLPPTDQPPTLPPTDQPTTLPPTDQPPTLPPTDQPSTLPPTDQPSTVIPPVSIKYNYAEAIKLSIKFYEAQRSGKLPANNRIPYRGDSALEDGADKNVNLTGGWYDAGDGVKFNFPMAASTTVLATGLMFFGDAYTNAGQLDYVYDSIKWPLDYFLKCWKPSATNPRYYAQVGNGDIDHSFWSRPEDMNMNRPSYYVDKENPGSDVAGETAAALAAGSIVFIDRDLGYSQTLLEAAEGLHTFAKSYQGKYSDVISDAAKFYKSHSGYRDELCLSSIMLYLATTKQPYLDDAKQFVTTSTGYALSWDEKKVLCQALLAMVTGDEIYKSPVQNFVKDYMPGGGVHQTGCGLAWRAQWGSLRYSANAAFVALLAADIGIGNSETYKSWAMSQIHYMLGDNNYGSSYLIGFGNDYPKRPHHRASSCPDRPQSCGWNNFNADVDNPQTLLGALVGGPNDKDQYSDKRNDHITNEVTTDYNAGFQSALAGLLHFALDGSLPDPPKPKCTASTLA